MQPLNRMFMVGLTITLLTSACQPIQPAAEMASSEAASAEAPAAEAMMEGMEMIAEGLNGPQGILVDAEGNVWVIDSGLGGTDKLPFTNPQTGEAIEADFGQSARVVMIAPDGTQTEVATLPSISTGQDVIGGARLAVVDDTLYATVGQWLGDPASTPTAENLAAIVSIDEDGVTQVADTWAIESSENPDPNIFDTHPYGLAAGPDGMLYMTDAGGNDLLRFDPETGEGEVIAVFAGIPGPFPNPGRGDAMEADPVPTQVTFDADGNAYVSFLSGFPFVPGSAKVVKVTAEGEVSDYATGLTMLTDLRTAPDGQMYAVQFGIFGEQGPVPNSGAIVRVAEGDASEVVVDGLSFPTSLDFNEAGDAYVVINGVGAPGSGAVVKIADLVSLEGMAMAK